MTGASFVGIDLAWGDRARTGMAALDSSGRVVASASVRHDDQILQFLQDHAALDMVVAIDAPIIVTNATGRRPCEAEVQREFGRYGAGPYPSNLTRPHFANGTRAQRLADAFGLTLDHTARAGRRAIEVYPHPALVVLLDLLYVIPYKSKHGRDLEALTAAFARLLDGIEEAMGTVLALDAYPRWRELRQIAEEPLRKVDLEIIEDEIDAIVCAFLAWHWHEHGEARNHVFGDASTGCIVTPKFRSDQRPTPTRAAGVRAASPSLEAVLLDVLPHLTADQLAAVASVIRGRRWR